MLPLVTHQVANSPLFIHGRDVVTRGEFVSQAQQLAVMLPDAAYVINLCQDRYHFSLAFAAACLRGQTNLLPASPAGGALQTLIQTYPNHRVIDDAYIRKTLSDMDVNDAPQRWPSLPQTHLAAIAFTSGSTGHSQGHRCTWGTLISSARRSAGRIFTQRSLNLVATVPPQHMFGLETTILQPLVNDCAIHRAKPFFPAEIFDALRALPEPRALISTPAHLKTCFDANPAAPAVEFVLSATAPLSSQLASKVEDGWHTQVLEIYGSTETGAIATRRTSQGDTWRLMQGGELLDTERGIAYRAAGAEAVPLHDTLIRSDAAHFVLGARNQDLIKVAGKRASLADLNARLLAIDGVLDGAIFQPKSDERVAALVVVKNLTARDILTALAANIDTVFLPRPLRIVSALPRDAVGKLPRAALLAALEKA